MEETTKLRLYGPIDGFTMLSTEIRSAVDNGSESIDIAIDSPGGSVFAGFSIISAIQEAQTAGIKVNVHIEAIAASMGAIIAVMADNVTINSYASMMIHSVSGQVQTEEDLELLQNLNQSLKDVLKKRTGKDLRTINKWMRRDTWFTAEQALAEGLVNSIIKVESKQLQSARVDRIHEIYNFNKENESEDMLSEFAALYDDSIKTISTNNMLEKIQALLPDVTEETVTSDIQAMLDGKAELEVQLADFTAEITGLKADVEAKDAQLEEAHNMIDEYRKVEADLEKAKAEDLINSAIEEGKISVDTKEQWLNFAHQNFDNTSTILNGISVNPKLHILAETTNKTNEIKITAHDAYVESLAKNQNKF